jgi:quercetin dioxygenase-like cupin family protein
MSSAYVVSTKNLPRAHVGGVDDPSVRWAGAFASYGGHGATQSSTIVYEIEPGGRLGWHTDATEETQYILAGSGELHMEDGAIHKVGPGDVFVLPTPVRHDLANTGKETLRAVAFFAAPMFTQQFAVAQCPSSRDPEPGRLSSARAGGGQTERRPLSVIASEAARVAFPSSASLCAPWKKSPARLGPLQSVKVFLVLEPETIRLTYQSS